jgi:hypothetical protein
VRRWCPGLLYTCGGGILLYWLSLPVSLLYSCIGSLVHLWHPAPSSFLVSPPAGTQHMQLETLLWRPYHYRASHRSSGTMPARTEKECTLPPPANRAPKKDQPVWSIILELFLSRQIPASSELLSQRLGSWTFYDRMETWQVACCVNFRFFLLHCVAKAS